MSFHRYSLFTLSLLTAKTISYLFHVELFKNNSALLRPCAPYMPYQKMKNCQEKRKRNKWVFAGNGLAGLCRSLFSHIFHFIILLIRAMGF